ncbi:MAG: RNA polymerase sigma factor [Candidatus Gracilibacteria bacterium]|nr:RNA polymerase sigma factor [Candidatus Gracilibacteria bacterium]
MEDREIVAECQTGDFGQFGELYDRYIDKIYKFIYLKTSNKQVAEDLTSDVFYKVLNSLSQFDVNRVETSFKSWLYTIANNKIIDFYRTKKEHFDIEMCFDLSSHSDVLGDIDNKDKLQKIIEFLDTLKPDQKEIIILRIWEDLSYKEISEITGKTLDNCKKIVSRGLINIKENFLLLLIFIFLF